MGWFRDFLTWLTATFRYWYVWVGASATVGILSIVKAMGWWDLPGTRVYTGLLVTGFVISAYQTWRTEYLGRIAAERAKSATEKRIYDGRPIVGLDIFQPQSMFTLCNCGTRPARWIKVQTVQSRLKKLFPSFSRAGTFASGTPCFNFLLDKRINV
jgi:hypothetical protein